MLLVAVVMLWEMGLCVLGAGGKALGAWCCGAFKAAVDTELAGSMLPNPSVPSVASPLHVYVCLSLHPSMRVCTCLQTLRPAAGLAKGSKPQVAPLSSLLGKLQARQAALEAK